MALAAAFLAAQGIALEHRLDFDGHPADEICAVCLSVTGLGGANVGKTESVAIPAVTPSLPDYHFTTYAPRPRSHCLARAPPTVS